MKVIKSEGWDFVSASEGWNGSPNEGWGYVSTSEGWDGND